jgi:hypothetical protein
MKSIVRQSCSPINGNWLDQVRSAETGLLLLTPTCGDLLLYACSPDAYSWEAMRAGGQQPS